MTRIVVGAGYGLLDWLAQRITALLMVVFTVFLAVLLLAGDGSYESWRALMSHGLVRFASFIFIVALCWHAWVGVRDIWMDYVKPTGIRLFLHVATFTALVGYAGWAAMIIWRL